MTLWAKFALSAALFVAIPAGIALGLIASQRPVPDLRAEGDGLELNDQKAEAGGIAQLIGSQKNLKLLFLSLKKLSLSSQNILNILKVNCSCVM